MRSKAKAINLHVGNDIRLRTLSMSGVITLLLAVAATAFAVAGEGLHSTTEDVDPIRVVASEKTGDSERVTLAIPIVEGAEIDVETSKTVRIDSWDGDEVLVIVERVVKPGIAKPYAQARPMDIHITRRGKDISIRAMNELGVQGVDVLFRIVVPRSLTATPSTITTSYDLSKLTGVVLGALHKEAVRWVIR